MGSQVLPGHPVHHVSSRISASSPTLQARLHNFVKHALLQQLVPPGSTVCDLYCGQGMDTGKWAQAQIGRYIGVDFSTSSLEEAWEQWNNHNRPYSADFCEVDPSLVNLENELRYMGLPADFVTCMGHLQDCFLTEEMVRKLLQNVASILKPGGYFFGITADSSTIWSKFQKAVEGAHRAGVYRVLPRVHSEYYTISFEDDRFTPFGTRYTLQFVDGVIFEGQQLIHFPSFIRLAEEVGLEYMELQNLQEFYDDYRLQFPDILRATCANLVDPKGRLPQFAHDILSLYTTFIFKKADYLDPDYMLSPFPPLDEDQPEICSEDAYDGSRALFIEHLSPPNEINIAPKILPATFEQNEAREACFSRLDEEQRPRLITVQVEEHMHQSPKNDARKENSSVDYIGSNSKHLDFDGNEEVRLESRLESKAVVEGVMTVSRRGDMEIQMPDRSVESAVVVMGEASRVTCDGLPDKDRPYPAACMEEQVLSDLSLPINSQANINSGNPANESKQHQNVTDEGAVTQMHATNGDEEMREASITASLTNECLLEEQKEQSLSEDIPLEENISKQSNISPCLLSEENLKSKDIAPSEDPTVVVGKDTSLADLEIKEVKGSDQQSDNLKNIMLKEPEVPLETDQQKSSSPATGVCTDDSKPSSKGRANSAAREETYSSSSKRLNSGGQQHYRAGRPHHYHYHLEDRQEHSHGPRHGHNSHTSHKASRDRVGDHRSEHSSPTQRAENRRARSRSAAHHSSPAFVPFSHFIPQTEFPIFHSPNTPGILGPGPPSVLVIEPICPLWPIPPPLERRVFPKIRTPRKHVSERDASGSRTRKESPKRHWKESSPPGTDDKS